MAKRRSLLVGELKAERTGPFGEPSSPAGWRQNSPPVRRHFHGRTGKILRLGFQPGGADWPIHLTSQGKARADQGLHDLPFGPLGKARISRRLDDDLKIDDFWRLNNG